MWQRRQTSSVRSCCQAPLFVAAAAALTVIAIVVIAPGAEARTRPRVNFLGRLAVQRHLLNIGAAAATAGGGKGAASAPAATAASVVQRQLLGPGGVLGGVCRHLITEVHEERLSERCIEEQICINPCDGRDPLRDVVDPTCHRAPYDLVCHIPGCESCGEEVCELQPYLDCSGADFSVCPPLQDCEWRSQNEEKCSIVKRQVCNRIDIGTKNCTFQEKEVCDQECPSKSCRTVFKDVCQEVTEETCEKVCQSYEEKIKVTVLKKKCELRHESVCQTPPPSPLPPPPVVDEVLDCGDVEQCFTEREEVCEDIVETICAHDRQDTGEDDNEIDDKPTEEEDDKKSNRTKRFTPSLQIPVDPSGPRREIHVVDRPDPQLPLTPLVPGGKHRGKLRSRLRGGNSRNSAPPTISPNPNLHLTPKEPYSHYPRAGRQFFHHDNHLHHHGGGDAFTTPIAAPHPPLLEPVCSQVPRRVCHFEQNKHCHKVPKCRNAHLPLPPPPLPPPPHLHHPPACQTVPREYCEDVPVHKDRFEVKNRCHCKEKPGSRQCRKIPAEECHHVDQGECLRNRRCKFSRIETCRHHLPHCLTRVCSVSPAAGVGELPRCYRANDSSAKCAISKCRVRNRTKCKRTPCPAHCRPRSGAEERNRCTRVLKQRCRPGGSYSRDVCLPKCRPIFICPVCKDGAEGPYGPPYGPHPEDYYAGASTGGDENNYSLLLHHNSRRRSDDEAG